jgi:hypothetical protein
LDLSPQIGNRHCFCGVQHDIAQHFAFPRRAVTTHLKMSSKPVTAAKGAQDVEDDEEDYMSMTIVEPEGKETFAQSRLRKQREVGALFFMLIFFSPSGVSMPLDCFPVNQFSARHKLT